MASEYFQGNRAPCAQSSALHPWTDFPGLPVLLFLVFDLYLGITSENKIPVCKPLSQALLLEKIKSKRFGSRSDRRNQSLRMEFWNWIRQHW